MVLWIGLKECACFVKCLPKLEDWLAVLKAFLCSRKRVTYGKTSQSRCYPHE